MYIRLFYFSIIDLNHKHKKLYKHLARNVNQRHLNLSRLHQFGHVAREYFTDQ